MTFFIQDPKDPVSPFLHESLLEKCEQAIGGGGAFAFATKEGAELLLTDEAFKKFLKKHPFDLLVGIDETTNVRALQALKQLTDEFDRLKVRVFHHDLPEAIFHPKFCWFRHKSGGFLVVGSGNLTRKGLRGNWEAYTVTELTSKGVEEIEKKWREWIDFHSIWLKAPDDERVLARAALNIWRAKSGGIRIPEITETETIDGDLEVNPSALQQSDAVLVAEIPKGGKGEGRWKQAGFDLDTFRTFFEVELDAVHRIVLQYVNADGTLGQIESRPRISVKSSNYRFELGAAAGLPYPDLEQGRPIGVFIRIATRSFLYYLLMPNDLHYQIVLSFLKSRTVGRTGRADSMRRVKTNAVELRLAWPDSPLWLARQEGEN